MTFSQGTGTNDWAMTFTGSVSAINAALNGMTFTPGANAQGDFSISADVRNAIGDSSPGTPAAFSIAVGLSVAVPANTQGTHTQNSPLTFSSATGNAIFVTDPAAGANGDMIVMLSTVSGATLTLTTEGGLSSVSGDGSGNVQLEGSASAINAALNGLVYAPTNSYWGNDTIYASVDYVNDIHNSDQTWGLINLGIGGSVLNMPVGPLDTNTTKPLVVGGIFLQPPMYFGDSNRLTEKVTLTTDDGTLSLPSTYGLTFQNGTGTNDTTMTFTGSLADVNQLLDFNGLIYTPSAGFVGETTLNVSVTELPTPGAPDTSTLTGLVHIEVGGPSLTAPTDWQGSNAVDSTGAPALILSTATGNALSLADPNGDGTVLQVSIGGAGALTLATTAGLTFSTGTGSGDLAMTFSGTVADINRALDGLLCAPGSGSNYPTSIEIIANEAGNPWVNERIVSAVFVNIGRIFPPIQDRVNVEGDTVSFQVVATDPFGISYSAVGLPAGLSINPDTGLISGTIITDNSDIGVYSVDITITNWYGSLTRSFSWQVNPNH